ncbi:MAG: hypothetical protein BroJett003_22700 [Planctomycetota bacterium]|nr:MAG: hypothetical protein BroJett003_22700 [Planctomycetota bacterium]
MSSSMTQGPQGPPPEDYRPAADPAAALRGGPEPAGELPKETPIWTGRTHWKYFLPGVALWVLGMLAVSWLLLKAFASPESTWVGTLLTVLWLGSAVVVFGRIAIRIIGQRYRLTTQRLFIEKGILSQTIDQTELLRVDDVRMHRTVVDRMFGLGTVEVMSTDSTNPRIRIVGIAAPDTVAEHIRMNMRVMRKKALFVENL